MNDLLNRLAIPALSLLAGLIPRVEAQPCAKPADADWQKVVLVDGASPMKLDKPVGMSILPDGRIFLPEVRSGKIKLYTPGSGVTEVGAVMPGIPVANGLLGLAVDPGFAANNWVYLFFARQVPGPTYAAGDPGVIPHEHVLVRMTFANGKLGNMKDILSFRRLTERHGGGGMAFHPVTGDLYLTTGDDAYPLDQATHWGARNEAKEYLNSLGTSANTNDLRGKVLRIKPIPFPDSQTPVKGIGTTYAIPTGNLFPMQAGGQAMPATRPEIFAMGLRNPFKVKLDSLSGAVLISDVGPDADGPMTDRGPTGSDEFNLALGPSNFGWPFAVADNQAYIAYDGEAYPKGTRFDMKALKNLSKYNTGLVELPAATGALGYYNARFSQTGPNTVFGSGGESAVAGPYYRYDATKPASRLPAFFHGKYIVGDWSRNKIWALELDANKALKKVENLWSNVTKIIDLEVGPDGVLYVLTLATGSSYEGDDNTGVLYRMQFKGAHYEAAACPQSVMGEGSTSLPWAATKAHDALPARYVYLAIHTPYRAPAGASKATLHSLDGAILWQGQVRDGSIEWPADFGLNLGLLRFE